jgi:hypothetical protein
MRIVLLQLDIGSSHIGPMMGPTTFADAWDWQTNTASGAAVFASKLSRAISFESQIRSACPALRALTGTERENMAVMLYGSWAHSALTLQYYTPNADGADWIVNTANNPDGVAYADGVRAKTL